MIFGGNLGPGVAIVLTVIDYSIRLLAIIFVPVNRKPQTATAWLLAIFAIPTLGLLATARKYIHVEFYILAFDKTTTPFFDAMQAAVDRGVTVRVLLDHVASVRSPGYHRTIRKLKKIGVDWNLMLPVQPWKGKFQRPDLRNHRKLLIIDGTVAFTGSQNMVDRSYNKRINKRKRDTATRLTTGSGSGP